MAFAIGSAFVTLPKSMAIKLSRRWLSCGLTRLVEPLSYSPDFNRIEKCWAWLKSRIRKRVAHCSSLRDAIELVLKEAVPQPL